jgi:hypothetical protein
MQSQFHYSILYYQPTQLIEERYAIGLLFFFPGKQEISFLYPNNLLKLRNFLPDADISFLKKNLIRFSSKAGRITSDWEKWFKPALALSFEDIINFEFLIPDSSSLFFSDIKSGVLSVSRSALTDYYFKLYFNKYLLSKDNERVDEPTIIHSLAKLIKTSIPHPNKIIRNDIELEGRFFKEKFDFGWQNGKFNLITPLSFDLKQEDSIKKKAQQWIGILANLEDIAIEKGYNFDFIIAKPSDKSLLKAYHNAVAILEAHDSFSRIFEEKQLQEYVEEIKTSAKIL